MSPVSVQDAGRAVVEARLSDGVPFGRYAYIAERVAAVYTDLLDVIAAGSVAAEHLLARVDGMSPGTRTTVFRDALLRRTIEDGVLRIVTGIPTIDPETLDELLAASTAAAVDGSRTLLDRDGRGTCLGPTPDLGHVWVEDHSDALPGRRFREEVLKRIPGFRIHPATPQQVEVLAEAARLAMRVAPELARSALSHTFMVVVGDFEGDRHQFNSFTLPGLPGVLILSPDALSGGTAAAAEALFHEAVHLKFLDIDYIHPLFAPGFRQATSPRITPAWHEDDPEYAGWPVDRVLTSMHVYLCLTVYAGRAVSVEEVRDLRDWAARAEQCRTRATWLFDTAQGHRDHLSASGEQFLASIGAMLGELDAQP